MSVYSKIPLSSSTHGRGILVAATTIGTGTTIHTAPATTTDGLGDVVTLFAVNSHSIPIVLKIGWGGTTDPDDVIVQSIPAQTGLSLIVADLVLRNSLIIKASADTTNKIVVFGYANRIS